MLDNINSQKLNPKQALDAMASYSVAQEGTNTLFLGLTDILARRDSIDMPYTLTEVEMVLNFFPHSLFQDPGNSTSE